MTKPKNEIDPAAQRRALKKIDAWVDAQDTIGKRDEIIVQARAADVPGGLIANLMGICTSTVTRAVRIAKEEGTWPGSS